MQTDADLLPDVEFSDRALISQVRAGEPRAFGVLYERHRDVTLRVAIKLCAGSGLGAEDCVADAFAKTLAALQEGKGPDEFFRSYLYAVMRNAVQASNKVDSQSILVDDFELIERNSKEQYVDPAITRFETEVVRTAFSAIPEQWQSVLWYSDIEGMKPAEVAPLLGLSSHGVSMLRTRAREGLRNAYLQAHLSSTVPGSACEGVASKLGSFARMTLSARDRTKVDQHLAVCTDCTAMSAEAKDINRGLLGIIALLFLGGTAKEFFSGAGAVPSSVALPVAAASSSAAVFSFAAGSGSALAAVRHSPASPAPRNKAAALGLAGGRPVLVVVAGLVLVLTFLLFNDPVVDESIDIVVAAEPNLVSKTMRLLDDDPIEISDGRIEIELGPDSGLEFELDVVATPPFAPTPDATHPPALPPPPMATDPVPEPAPLPVNLLANGGFDAPGYNTDDGKFLPGTAFEGWTLAYEGDSHTQVVRVWYPELDDVNIQVAAPFESGPWIRLVGKMTQTIPTVVGETYLLEYDTRATGTGLFPTSNGWNGGSPGNVLVDGVVVDQFVTVADPVYSPGSVVFTATSTSTELSFVTTGFHGVQSSVAAGLDNISVTLVAP